MSPWYLKSTPVEELTQGDLRRARTLVVGGAVLLVLAGLFFAGRRALAIHGHFVGSRPLAGWDLVMELVGLVAFVFPVVFSLVMLKWLVGKRR